MPAHWEGLASLGHAPWSTHRHKLTLPFGGPLTARPDSPCHHRTCRPRWGQGWVTDSLGSGGSFLLEMYKPPTAYT